ncbi:MAG: hypothetical protein NZ578_17490, partial [Candidatus Binatia bacterium]|nr:hypothetical protein [Candidatus Binatia bacterium]
RNLVQGERHDLWSVNAEQEYLEEMETGIAEPELARIEEALARVFPRLDEVAFGLALGTAGGLLLCLATLWLVLNGGEVVGPTMQLLGQYFPGYSVTLSGSLSGLLYGFVSGFLGGSGFAWLRNTAVRLSMAFAHRRAERRLLRRFPEDISP